MWYSTVGSIAAHLERMGCGVGWGVLALALTLFGAPPVHAQTGSGPAASRCPPPGGGGVCPTTLITEAALLRQLSSEDGQGSTQGAYLGVSVGLMRPVGPRLGLGVVATGGVLNDLLFAAGPRLRLRASSSVTIAFTPQFVLAGGPGNRGHLLLDASVMASETIGMSVQVNWVDQLAYADTPPFVRKTGTRPIVHVGPRLGSALGRVGMVAAALTVLAVTIAYSSSAGL